MGVLSGFLGTMIIGSYLALDGTIAVGSYSVLVDAIERSNRSTVSPNVVKGHKNRCVKKTKTL